MRVSPYAPAGRFTSRVLDAGVAVDWHGVDWEADVPAPTSLAVEVRTGDVARPGPVVVAVDGRWPTPATAWAARPGYLQYRVHLATTDPSWTPVLREVRVRLLGSRRGAGASSSSLVSGRALGCQ